MLATVLVVAALLSFALVCPTVPAINNPFRRALHRVAQRPRVALALQYLAFEWRRLRSACAVLAGEVGGAYYTWMQGLGVTNLTTTFTHSLGQNGTNYVARILMKGNVGATQTAALQVVGVSTNTITIAPMLASTLITFDLEVEQIHSIMS